MAKTIDRELFDQLRAQGLRKRVARLVSEAAGAAGSANSRGNAAARNVIAELRKAADEIEARLRGGTSASSRSEAAQKAARTRKTAANKRSAAAKKAAATRKRNASSGTTRRRSTTARKSS
jgi:hypothetical protein